MIGPTEKDPVAFTLYNLYRRILSLRADGLQNSKVPITAQFKTHPSSLGAHWAHSEHSCLSTDDSLDRAVTPMAQTAEPHGFKV